MVCEYCGKTHDGSYGSGIFCSLHCCRGYAGSRARKNYSEYKQRKPRCDSKLGGWKCDYCGEVFRTRRMLQEHQKVFEHKLKYKGFLKIDFECSFCHEKFFQKNKPFKAAHENHCKMNPNGVPWKGHPQTEEFKKHLSLVAKQKGFGGWHSSKSFLYNGVKLDSTYEVTFAKSLDENKIKWERPKPLLWKLDGVEHRYYPDFFLPDYGVYVDTKNDYLINHVNPRFGITDLEKISLVESQNNVKVFVLDKNNLSWSSIATNF